MFWNVAAMFTMEYSPGCMVHNYGYNTAFATWESKERHVTIHANYKFWKSFNNLHWYESS